MIFKIFIQDKNWDKNWELSKGNIKREFFLEKKQVRCLIHKLSIGTGGFCIILIPQKL